MEQAQSEFSQSPWAEAVLIIDFDESHGQVVQHVYPNNAIPKSMLDDIKMISMPDCLEAGAKHEFTFQARVRNKEGIQPFEALNIYIYFKQTKNPASKRGYEQRSIVMACRHYYSDLSYRLLAKFSAVIDALPIYQKMLAESAKAFASKTSSPIAEADAEAEQARREETLVAAIEVCYQHFRQWPRPVPGRYLSLPFYGDMVEFYVPDIAPYVSGRFSPTAPVAPSSRPGEMGFGEGSGVLGEVNLMSVLAPLGLLPHLWTLWELVVTGRDIVVYSPSAAICSACVLALTTMAAPLVCCADMRCYINNYDNDVDLFASSANSKFNAAKEANTANSNGEESCATRTIITDTQYTRLDSIHVARSQTQNIIGITNPFLLRTFSKFQNAIFVPTDMPLVPELPAPGSDSSAGSISGLAKYLFGGKSSQSSPEKLISSGDSLDNIEASVKPGFAAQMSSPSMPPKLPPRLFKRAYGPARVSVMNPSTASLETVYDEWCAAGGAGRNKTGKVMPSRKGRPQKMGYVLVSLRENPTVSPDKSTLYRLSEFSSGEVGTSSVEPLGGSPDYETSDAVTLGGLLLREHFKMLTLTLLKPFDTFFTPVESPSSARRVIGKPSLMPSGLSSALAVRRVGAKSLWLYTDGATILGAPDAAEAIDTFVTFNQTNNMPYSLSSMGKTRIAAILRRLAETTTFKVWTEWRRNRMVSQLCLSMVETSRDLTLEQLLSAFAVELEKEVLLEKDVILLINRVENTIANVRAINSVASVPITDDAFLCGHMMQHLEELKTLLLQQSEAGRNVVYSCERHSPQLLNGENDC